MKKIDWIAVDWGTTNLRIWAMSDCGEVVYEVSSDSGMAGLDKDEYENILLSYISEWLGEGVLPVIACGMVGSRQGWFEAGYGEVPTMPTSTFVNVEVNDPRFTLSIVSGILQRQEADVMRGEETQISGFLASHPQYEGLIVLPGTHSKWVCIKNGEVTRFKTVMTGEIFGLLSEKSVLRHSLGTWNDEAFLSALVTTYKEPEKALSSLFSIRAKNLLNISDQGVSELSGILIGVEFAGMKQYCENKKLIIIGAGELVRLYQLSFEKLGFVATAFSASPLTIAGLQQVYEEKKLCLET